MRKFTVDNHENILKIFPEAYTQTTNEIKGSAFYVLAEKMSPLEIQFQRIHKEKSAPHCLHSWVGLSF